MKTKIFYIFHDDSLTKHLEIKKTRSLLQKKFYWFRMLKDMKKYIQNCNICQLVKAFRHRLYDKTTLFFISIYFWKKISMNFIIELSFNRYKNDTYNVILVVVNRYSKIIFYIFAKLTWSVKDLANILFDKMFLTFVEIKKVIFDQDLLFFKDYWFALYHCIYVKRKLSIVFHLQVDKQTKRQN